MKKIREILFFANNIFQLLVSLLLILIGAGGILAGVFEMGKLGSGSSPASDITLALGAPVIVGSGLFVFLPIIILGIISAIAVVFAVIRLIAKKKKRKFTFSVLNLLFIYLSALLILAGVTAVRFIIRNFIMVDPYGIRYIMSAAIRLFYAIPVITMLINVPLAALTVAVDTMGLKEEETDEYI